MDRHWLPGRIPDGGEVRARLPPRATSCARPCPRARGRASTRAASRCAGQALSTFRRRRERCRGSRTGTAVSSSAPTAYGYALGTSLKEEMTTMARNTGARIPPRPEGRGFLRDDSMTTKQNECECRKAERPNPKPPTVSPAFPRAAAVLTLHTQAGRGGRVFGQRARGFRRGAFRGVHARTGVAGAADDGIFRRGPPVGDDGLVLNPVSLQPAFPAAPGPAEAGREGPGPGRERLGVESTPNLRRSQ